MTEIGRALHDADNEAQRAFKRYCLATDQDAQTAAWIEYRRAEDVVDRLRGIEAHDADLEAAAHDAADWRLSVEQGRYVTLPDVPLAYDPAEGIAHDPVDLGNHYAFPAVR